MNLVEWKHSGEEEDVLALSNCFFQRRSFSKFLFGQVHLPLVVLIYNCKVSPNLSVSLFGTLSGLNFHWLNLPLTITYSLCSLQHLCSWQWRSLRGMGVEFSLRPTKMRTQAKLWEPPFYPLQWKVRGNRMCGRVLFQRPSSPDNLQKDDHSFPKVNRLVFYLT